MNAHLCTLFTDCNCSKIFISHLLHKTECYFQQQQMHIWVWCYNKMINKKLKLMFLAKSGDLLLRRTRCIVGGDRGGGAAQIKNHLGNRHKGWLCTLSLSTALDFRFYKKEGSPHFSRPFQWWDLSQTHFTESILVLAFIYKPFFISDIYFSRIYLLYVIVCLVFGKVWLAHLSVWARRDPDSVVIISVPGTFAIVLPLFVFVEKSWKIKKKKELKKKVDQCDQKSHRSHIIFL